MGAMGAIAKQEALRKMVKTITSFEGGVFEAHHPKHMWCSCVDGREKAGGNLDLGDDTIRTPEIAVAFPPYENLSDEQLSQFSFRKLKGILTINLNGHSDCGGAQAAIAYPDPDNIPEGTPNREEIARIVRTIAKTGVNLPHLRDSFMAVSNGNDKAAADLLSRHLVLQSFKNVLDYPNIEDRVMSGDLHVIPYYHDLKAGTGQPSHLERYDVKNQAWVPAAQNAMTEMFVTPKGSFAEYLDMVNHALEGTMVAASVNGKQTEVEVPRHIARFLGKEGTAVLPKSVAA